MRYLCTIEIDVDADTPEIAAARAWALLSAPGAFLPVVDCTPESGDPSRVDLQELNDINATA